MAEDGLGVLLGSYDSEEEDHAGDLSHLTGPGTKLQSAALAQRPATSASPAAQANELAQSAAGGAADVAAAGTWEQQSAEVREPPPPPPPPQPPPPPPPPPQQQGQQGQLQEPAAQPPLEGCDAEWLPPELPHPPPGQCAPEVQARVAKWLALQARGRHLTDELRASRDYRNPQFFRKMVEYWEIDERGTSLPPEVYDPRALPPEDSVQALRAEWAAEEERRRAARAAGTARIEFTKPAAAVQPAAPATMQTAAQQAAVNTAVAAAQAKAAALAAAACGGAYGFGGVPNPGARR